MPSLCTKRYKYLVIFDARNKLLESLSATISPEIQARWTAELQNVYFHRFVPLETPENYNPKYMDDVFRAKFDSNVWPCSATMQTLMCFSSQQKGR